MVSISALRWGWGWRRHGRSEAACCSTGRTFPPRCSVNIKEAQKDTARISEWHGKEILCSTSVKKKQLKGSKETFFYVFLTQLKLCRCKQKYIWTVCVQLSVNSPVVPFGSTSEGLFFLLLLRDARVMWAPAAACDFNGGTYRVTLSIATRQARMLSINLWAETVTCASFGDAQTQGVYLAAAPLWGTENKKVLF